MRLAIVSIALAAAACVKTPRDYQLEYAKSLTPAELAPSVPRPGAEPAGPERLLKVRVYVDLDYQAQVMHWQERLDAMVARANAFLRPTFNASLVVVSTASWDRRGGLAPLEAQLLELERLDPGADVDLVLGFVSSLDVFTDDLHTLATARLAGRHAVLRGMENAPETRAISEVFTTLDVDEKVALYRSRKLHKETSVLLHEWGHTLGAPHEVATTSLMCGTYTWRVTGIAPETRELISLSLRANHGDRAAWARQLIGALEAAPAGTWDRYAVKDELEHLRQVAAGTDRQSLAAAQQQEHADANEVVRLARGGKTAEALALLDTLVAKHAQDPWLLATGCGLEVMRGPGSAEARGRCRAAADAPGARFDAFLGLAETQLAAKELPAARASLRRGHELLLAAKDVPGEPWSEVASLARRLGFVTWAEEAAPRAADAGERQRASEWAMRKRRWVGLPAGAAVPAPAAEPEYLEAFRAVQDDLNVNQLGKAEAGIARLESTAPGPGPLTLRCELTLRRGAMPRAVAECERAAAAFADDVQAHYLLGVMKQMLGQARTSAEHLERVVQLDPSVDDAWKRLEALYRELHDAQGLARVRGHSAAPRPSDAPARPADAPTR